MDDMQMDCCTNLITTADCLKCNTLSQTGLTLPNLMFFASDITGSKLCLVTVQLKGEAEEQQLPFGHLQHHYPLCVDVVLMAASL